jgi:membrane associated rhomboid family serine protease
VFPLRDDIPSRRTPVVMVTILLINAVVFAMEVLAGPEAAGLIQRYGLVPARELRAFTEAPLAVAAWFAPVLTSMFLHGGWMHVIGNLWFLWIFGDNVEDRFGSARFLLFYLGCGVVAALTQVFFHSGSWLPMVGASGAIAGVLGAYFVLYPKARVMTFIPIFIFPYLIRVPAVIFLGLWFGQQVLAGGVSIGTGASGGVAWWAHAGGFACGALQALPLRRRAASRVPREDDWLPLARRYR